MAKRNFKQQALLKKNKKKQTKKPGLNFEKQ